MDEVEFGNVMLLTHERPRDLPQAAQWHQMEPLTSSRAYSEFILRSLPAYVTTSHCLLVQWDGHVLNGTRWRDEFLSYDYIGASWPQFQDGLDVGNGGFSLRSRALLEACQHSDFVVSHPEDLAIGRINRAWLEERGLRFAKAAVADWFSAERKGDPLQCFGYHGVWHMPRALGLDDFWRIYAELDERGTVRNDFHSILRQCARGRDGLGRAMRLLYDRFTDATAPSS
ncbi:DUF5672 family protein [Erythrobacter sp. sf7]|uniref:DUF5672 family protein n=1 Tax=Erythrobacter fulvus TaxID=2987523 RepID=A0ABT5JNP6_9SPHN|nr:DUF5672 family protein [Erythrobacter fulvus]MDC8753790.1 DUF5672 family protein [Erythrobacter fulvus]